jgi:hypothetical protein
MSAGSLGPLSACPIFMRLRCARSFVLLPRERIFLVVQVASRIHGIGLARVQVSFGLKCLPGMNQMQSEPRERYEP